MVDLARVQKELQECNRDVQVSGISVSPKGDSLTHLIGSVPGPLGTPYEGGIFKIDITVPDGYPFEPPRMRFVTKALLSAPEPDDPQDAVVAQQYLKDYQTFVSTARYWTEAFAKASSLGVEEKVQKLVEMGFPEDVVRSTLEAVGGDENLALEKLCPA